MKIKLSTFSIGAVLLLTCVGAAVGQTSLYITNNSFELPHSGSQQIFIAGTGATSTFVTGWTCATTAGYWDLNIPSGGGITNVDGTQVLESYNVGGGVAGVVYQELTNTWVAGATYTMTCRAGQPTGGNPPHTLDSVSIDTKNGSTLTQLSHTNLSNAQPGLFNYTVTYTATGSEAGDGHVVVAYHVPSGNGVGGMWVDDFAITQSGAPDPSVTTPASQTVSPGQTATFSVSGIGASAFSYQWQATNTASGGFTNLANGGQISGAHTNVLTISNASINNVQFYRVIATDTAGSITSSVASLTVNSQELIDVDVGGGPVQTGAAVLGVSTDVAWNSYSSTPASSLSNLKDSGGNTLTGVGLNVSAGQAYGNDATTGNLDPNTTPLMQDFLYNSTGLTTSVTGLTAYNNCAYTLVVYAAGTTYSGAQAATVSVTAGSTGTTPASGTVTSASRSLTNSPGGLGVAYQTFTGILTNSTLTFALAPASTGGINLNGFQLQIQLPNPGIATQPVSATNLFNTTAQFSVVASGNTPFGYQWQANGGSGYTNLADVVGVISGSQSNVLTFPNVSTNRALTYQVIVTNSFGSITSSPVTLAVLTLPLITNQPVSITRIAGQGASFSVGATGVGTLGYQWQATNSNGGGFTNVINGGNVSGANSTNLDIANVNTNWALTYQVIVTNANGSVTSSPASLAVLTPVPVVTPELINVDIGTTAHVQSGAAVLGAPGDVWNGVTTSTTNIVDSASNVLSGVAYAVAGYTGFNDQPGGSPHAVLDPTTTALMEDCVYGFTGAAVNSFTVNLNGLSAYNGNPFTLVVYATVGDPNQGATLTLAGAAGGNTGSTLVTTGASRSLTNTPPNGGLGVAYQTFTGILTNGSLTITATPNGLQPYFGINGFQLQFANQTFPDPSITINPSSQTVFPGTNVSFSVTATGSTPLTYQWQTNNGVGPFVNVGNNSIFSGTTSNVLTVTGVTTNQGLSYRVIASNFNGSVTSSPATLTLLTLPVITSQPASQATSLGQTNSFSVAVSGAGPFTYQWQATNSATSGFTNLANGSIFSGVNTNVLTISGVTSNQLLAYRVVVSNSSGSVTSSPALLSLFPTTSLFNVDFGSAAAAQTGAAVLGSASDVWNPVSSAIVNPIFDANSNSIVQAVITVNNGNQFYADFNGLPMDPGTTNLMEDYAYGFTATTANIVISVTNLTSYINSPFALIVYAAGDTAGQGATLTLAGMAGGNSTDTLSTTAATRQLSAGPGVAYTVFTGTLTNSVFTITATENAGAPFSAVNGFQLLLSPTLPPIFTNTPVSQGATAGQPFSFTAGVVGTAPFYYQWQATNSATGGFTNLVNGGVISGVNSNILTISSVTNNWALAYRIVVTNSQGSITSSPAILTVLPPPALVGEWFTGAQSLADQSGFTPAGTHDGIDDIGFNNAQWASGDSPVGHTGSSILFDGSYAVGITNSLNTDSNYQATFDLTLSKKMTVAFWAKYTAPDAKPFVAKNGTSVGWQFQNDTTTTNPEFTLKGTSTANLQSTSNVTDGNWHHYAGTWDGTTGIRSVYVDGVLTASLMSDLGTMTTAGNYRLLLGGRDTVGTGDANINGPFFNGQLYDVRIYNYALSQSQVQTLAGVTPTVSTNAYLSSLIVSPAGTLSPTFASNVSSYVTTEAYGNTPNITVVDADLTATNHLIYLGATNLLASGVASSALSLNSNPAVTNVVKVVVTAQDGVTTQTYLVNVVQLPSQTKPVLANSVSGGSLTLNWPLDHLGYRLLTQTNNLAKGVSANTNDWATVTGSSLTNTFTIPIVKTNLNQYYRLIYP